MTEPDGSTEIEYVKSAFSGNANCLEAGLDRGRDLIAVRHTQRRDELPLLFSRDEWHAFVLGVRAGQFDFT